MIFPFTVNQPVANTRKGEVIRVDYFNANKSEGTEKRTVKVLEVRDTERDPILPQTRWYNRIDRSRMLITGVDSRGLPRRFYGEAVATAGKRYTWLGRLVMWLVGKRFVY